MEIDMGYSVEVCHHCKRIFNYPGFGSMYCPECLKIDEENKNKVKKFLRDHGNANMYQIALATGVSEKDIKQYLRDGMLEIPDGSPIYIKCENCGCDIRSGRWCPSCAARMSNDLKSAYAGVGDVPKEQVTGKMRFFGNRNQDENRGRKKRK